MQTSNCHSFFISDQTPILVIFRRTCNWGQSKAITLKAPDHFIAEPEPHPRSEFMREIFCSNWKLKFCVIL